jgi:hypothetical protein
MLQEFIRTVYGFVVTGRFNLLREYFDLIDRILDQPPAHQPDRLVLKAVVSNKE